MPITEDLSLYGHGWRRKATFAHAVCSGIAMHIASLPGSRVRSAPRFGYFLATMGMGYAYVRRYDTDGNFCVAACRPDVVSRRSGFTVNTAVGWLFHPGASQFEIGPVARFDALQTLDDNRRTDYVFTLNLELGFALLSPDRRVQ